MVLIITCLVCNSIIENMYDVLEIHLNADKEPYYILKICFQQVLWTSIRKKNSVHFSHQTFLNGLNDILFSIQDVWPNRKLRLLSCI